MSGTAVDNVIQRLRKHSEKRHPGESTGRFLVTKLSWRGNYRRILAITPTGIVTQHPDSLAVTNNWSFSGDHDISAIEVGGDHSDGGIFIIHFRKDKKGLKSRDAKFACKDRGSLLDLLYTTLDVACTKGLSGLGPSILGQSPSFQGYKLKKGKWQPVLLRITPTALERIDPSTGALKWKWHYIHAAAPAARLLASSSSSSSSSSSNNNNNHLPAPGYMPFALFGKIGRSPRVFALPDRDAFLKAVQTAAMRTLGISLAVDSTSSNEITGHDLVAMIDNGRRERAATAEESPLGEWEVLKVNTGDETAWVADSIHPGSNIVSSTMTNTARSTTSIHGVKPVTPRRIILTHNCLLERRTSTYEIAEWKQLRMIASLVRFSEDPQWLGIEWVDGTPSTLYVTPARDALLSSIMHAVQNAAHRPVPVIPSLTGGGDSIVNAKGASAVGTPAIAFDSEIERMMIAQVMIAATNFYSTGAGDLSLNALALAGLTAAAAASSEHQRLPVAGLDRPSSAASYTDRDNPLSESSSVMGGIGGSEGSSSVGGNRDDGASRESFGMKAIALMEERLREFNACIPYSGVSQNVRIEEVVVLSLLSYLPKQAAAGQQATLSTEEARLLILALQCLQRLAASTSIAMQIVGAAGGAGRIFAALLSRHQHVAMEAARLLYRFFSPSSSRFGAPPWPIETWDSSPSPTRLTTHEEIAMSKAAKSVCFISDARCSSLLGPLRQQRSLSPLLADCIIEAVVAVACKPGARTTELSTRETMLQEVAAVGRPLFSLFNHPVRRVGDAAAMIMQAIAEGGTAAAAPMRDAALAEGAVLHHLLCALGPAGPRAQRSRDLVALWADGHMPSLNLLKRIFPQGLIRFLDEPKKNLAQPMRLLGPPPKSDWRVGTMSQGSSSPSSVAAQEHHQQLLQRQKTIYDQQQPSNSYGTASNNTQNGEGLGAIGGTVNIAPPPSVFRSIHEEHEKERSDPFDQGTWPLPLLEGNASSAAAMMTTSMLSAQESLLKTAQSDFQRQRVSGDLVPPDTAAVHSGNNREENAVAITEGEKLTSSQEDITYKVPEKFLVGQGAPKEAAKTRLRGNWEAFWSNVDKDHNHAALIWNERTRTELREGLQAEENLLRLGRQRVADKATTSPSWNSSDFSITYISLQSQLTIGGVHVKLLLEGADATGVAKLADPREFFHAVHLHFLRKGDLGLSASLASSASTMPSSRHRRSMSSSAWRGDAHSERELCVRAMAATYAAHAVDIGPFEGMQHLIDVIDVTESRSLRIHVLKLIEALVIPDRVANTEGRSDSKKDYGKANSSARDSGGAVPAALPKTSLTRKDTSSKYNTGISFADADEDEENILNSRLLSVAQANATSLVNAGGVDILVDLVSTAHEASERSSIALSAQQTNLIASSSHADEIKPWFYMPSKTISMPKDLRPDEWLAVFDEHRSGPVNKAEIRQLMSKGVIDGDTFFWTSPMQEPVALYGIRELRWWTAGGLDALPPLKTAEIALRVLRALTTLRPAVDAHGDDVVPLPLVHRQLASSRCLPHIAQVVLTGEPALVSSACSLILSVIEHNTEALPLVYRTGIFFFLLGYCGSNLSEAATLLRATHLKQHFRGVTESASSMHALAHRSFLGNLLPESLLFSLESYGPDAFAAALAGDSDTPEIIWTHKMRFERLVPQMQRHIGDFLRRLAQHSSAQYEYTPCPPVGYPEIKGEIWCHRYYLKHLCDEMKFPAWPLKDHVLFLQSLLDSWKDELARKPLGLSMADAARVLGLDPENADGISEEEMKSAYRRLARKYHPDRNPEGRETFEAVQKAYERLQAGGSLGHGGPQPWRILLLITSQCILYKRHSKELAEYKYAGYPLLLAALETTDDTASASSTTAKPHTNDRSNAPHFLSNEVFPRLQTAAELCWLTCAASKLNGEELTRSGGVALLGSLLTRCISVTSKDAPPNEPSIVLATQALRAFACMAAFPTARKDIHENRQQVVEDVLQACVSTRAHSMTDAALQCIIQMCRSSQLQRVLLERGVLGYAIPLLLQYDATTAEEEQEVGHLDGDDNGAPSTVTGGAATITSNAGGSPSKRPILPQVFEPSQETLQGPDFLSSGQHWSNIQSARNHHARLAVRALATLAGYEGAIPTTPACPEAQAALAGLLTSVLAPRLADRDPRPLLQDLNTTVASPHVIWNARMREELLNAAEQQRLHPGMDAVEQAARFSFASLRDKLVVAQVYVEQYNIYPSFVLKDPPSFCKGLVTCIHEVLHQGEMDAASRRHLLQCLMALSHVLDASPRLMGLLSTTPALDPLLLCIAPSCVLGHGGVLWPTSTAVEPHALLASSTVVDATKQQQPVTASGDGDEDESRDGILDAPRDDDGVPSEQSEHRSKSRIQDQVTAASLSLEILLKLATHAGCLEAMSQERCILQALWLVHRPPNSKDLLNALGLLRALSGSAETAWAVAAQGGAMYLLSVLLPELSSTEDSMRSVQDSAAVGAAAVLSRTMVHPLHGRRVALLLQKVLPESLVLSLRDDPAESAVAALNENSETPERLWTRRMRNSVAEEAAQLASAVRRSHAATSSTVSWDLDEDHEMKHEGLEDEVYVGGVYVRHYLKSPGYPLRNPQRFLEGVLERYISAVVHAGSGNESFAVVLSAAAVAGMQHHALLAEHGVALGYISKVLKILSQRAPQQQHSDHHHVPLCDDVSGSALRLLHALSAAANAGEDLARSTPPSVPVLISAMRWQGTAAVLAVETLKRGLSPMNRSRDLLVGAALHAGLLQMLLHELDWRSAPAAGVGASNNAPDTSDEASDTAVQRVLFVDVINLMSLDGTYSQQIKSILESSEVWAAYKGQRHDLFLPAGGSRAQGVVGLLKGSEAVRFALPAPESWATHVTSSATAAVPRTSDDVHGARDTSASVETVQHKEVVMDSVKDPVAATVFVGEEPQAVLEERRRQVLIPAPGPLSAGEGVEGVVQEETRVDGDTANPPPTTSTTTTLQSLDLPQIDGSSKGGNPLSAAAAAVETMSGMPAFNDNTQPASLKAAVDVTAQSTPTKAPPPPRQQHTLPVPSSLPSPSRIRKNEALSPTKVFHDPLSALGGNKETDNA